MNKNFIILTITILLLSLTGCKQEDNNEQLVGSFLNNYYSQYIFTENEWDKIMLELRNKESVIELDGNYIEKEDNDTFSFLDEFNKYLTQECLNTLMANRYIPNFNMMNSEVDSFEISNLEIKDMGDENYKVKYELKLLKKEKIEIENKEIEMKIIEDKTNNKKLIEHLKG